MARSRRGGSVSRAPAPAPQKRPASTQAHAPPPAPTPAPQQHMPAPMQQPSGGGGMLSGLASTVAQGMAFGTGSAIAHRAVGAVANSFGGGSGDEQAAAAPQPAAAAAPAPGQSAFTNNVNDVCGTDKQMFYDCLNQNKGDQSACQFLYEQLKQCQQNQVQFG